MIRLLLSIIVLLLVAAVSGCSVFAFGGSMMQAHEDQKLIEKYAAYDVEGKTVAVVIDTDLAVHYEHPGISNLIAEAIAGRIAKFAKNVQVIHPGLVAQWQFETPQWSAMPTTEIATSLNVDCVIYIDLHNYRLTPPGNQWLWEGLCSATIGIIEANSYEQDGFAETFDISVTFPKRPSVLSREEASEADIERGLLNEFIKETAWLFYFHVEPKHPDRYRQELEK
ncbi:MAG: hypothetical protein H8E86_06325 [Planctomycetes bacterium]|nr:hypothetical protein [Planctomycetota bacterium]